MKNQFKILLTTIVAIVCTDVSAQLWDSSGANIYYSNGSGGLGTGNVGIGTTDPSDKLEITRDNGGLDLTHSTNTSYSSIEAFEGSTSQGTIQFLGSNFSTVDRRNAIEIVNRKTSGNIDFFTENSFSIPKVRIKYNGNVGIGTSSPANKLEVHETELNKSAALFRFQSTTAPTSGSDAGIILLNKELSDNTMSSIKFIGTDPGGSSRHMANIVSGKEAGWQSGNSSTYRGFLSFWTRPGGNQKERLRITADGNVGIGTSSPSKPLHVYSSTIDQVALFESGDPYAGIEFRDNLTTASNVLIRAIENDLALNAGGAQRIRIASNGNVGIGTTSPVAGYDLTLNTGTLHLGTSGTQEIKFGGGGSLNFNDGGNNVMFSIEDKGSIGDFYFNGNVGIGTTTPATDYKLSVAGKIMAEGVKVQVGPWPDYVFSKDYNLKSLSETESYINKEGHLPNIPSAKEVSENGIELGEMNAKLLEKIEELTLHLINQQKEIEALKVEVKSMK